VILSNYSKDDLAHLGTGDRKTKKKSIDGGFLSPTENREIKSLTSIVLV
jgi:hypothetical protein